MNELNIKVTGHRILVKLEGGEKKSKGGLILTDDTAQKSENGSIFARVLDIGPDAWADREPYCKVGDRVIIGKYAGFTVSDKDSRYRILDDLNIMAVISEDFGGE